MLNIEDKNKVEFLVKKMCLSGGCLDCQKTLGHNIQRESANICIKAVTEFLMEEPKEPEIDWWKVPRGTKVYLKEFSSDEWIDDIAEFVAYLPNFNEGAFLVTACNATLKTAEYVYGWDYCKLANPEDIEKYKVVN